MTIIERKLSFQMKSPRTPRSVAFFGHGTNGRPGLFGFSLPSVLVFGLLASILLLGSTWGPTASTTVVKSNGVIINTTPAHLAYEYEVDAGPRYNSTVWTHVSSHGADFKDKPYYRFENVQLTRKAIKFYYLDGFMPPENIYYDMVECNSTNLQPPKVVAINGERTNGSLWYHLPVKYLPAEEYQPTCTRYIDKPTYLLQVRYSKNIWHTWDEGLMGAFQTLRELGHLPLIEVQEDGTVQELPQADSCGWSFRQGFKTFKRHTCPPASTEKTKCTPGKDWWCIPGIVNRNRDTGPLILPYNATSLANKWYRLYQAMSVNIGDFDELEGTCFKELIVGRTSTLDFKPFAYPAKPTKKYFENRQAALAVFKRFIVSSLLEIGYSIQKRFEAGENPAELEAEDDLTGVLFNGYQDLKLDEIRKGVISEDMSKLLTLRKNSTMPSLKPEDKAEMSRYMVAQSEVTLAAVNKWRAFRGQFLWTLERTINGPVAPSTPPPSSPSPSTNKAAAATEEEERRRLLADTDDDTEGEEATAAAAAAASVLSAPPPPPPRQYSIAEGWDAPINYTARGLEKGYPVVTVIKRNFWVKNRFSRTIMNLYDVLAYTVARYRVKVKVITFEEPLLEGIRTLAHSDVIMGMHGAAWTNLLFVKPGATVLQMYPYGWNRTHTDPESDLGPIRGITYQLVAEASDCKYSEWTNPNATNAFFRPTDFIREWLGVPFKMHPDPSWPLPMTASPGNPWIYQATYIDMDLFAEVIDGLMARAGIPLMELETKEAGGGKRKKKRGGSKGKATDVVGQGM